jgi:hypothetical protein
MSEAKLERFVVSEKGLQELESRSWGGARPGAGRPRTESLDEAELTFLAWMVDGSAYSNEQAELTSKLLRMADRVGRVGR